MAWRQVRGLLLLGVIVVNLIYAIPYPRIDEEDLADPEWRSADFERWEGWLGAAGVHLQPGWLMATTKEVGWAYKQVLVTLRAPFSPYYDFTQTNQQWGLFAAVTEAPDALIVEVRRSGEWEELYRRLHPEHDWHDRQLKFRRMRGVWDGVKEEPKGTYKRFSVWLARQVFAEQPDVDRVRVLLEKRYLTLPWEEPDERRERRAERYHKRENHMPGEAR